MTNKRFAYTGCYVFLIFFSLGLFSIFLEAVTPVLKVRFNFNYIVFTTFDVGFFVTYALFAYPIATQLEKVSLKRAIQTGFVLVAIGVVGWALLIYLPHTMALSYILSSFALAMGTVVLMICTEMAALYLTGKPRLEWLTFFQSAACIGAATSPWLVSHILYTGKTISESSLPKLSPLFLGGLIILLVLIVLARFADFEKISEARFSVNKEPDDGFLEGHTRLKLIWLALFISMGIETGIGSFIINQGVYHFHVTPKEAALALTAYWLLFSFTRLTCAWFFTKYSPNLIMLICSAAGLVLITIATLSPSTFGFYAMITIGISNALLFPLLYGMGLSCHPTPSLRLSGFMATAISGGGFIPLLMGFVIHRLHFLPAGLSVCIVGYVLLIILSIKTRPQLFDPTKTVN